MPKFWHSKKKKNPGLFIQRWNLNYFATEKSGRALIPHPSSPTQAAGRQRGNYALWSHSIVAHMRARETISVLWHSYGIGFVCAGIVLLPKRGSVNPFLYHCCCLEPDSSTVYSSCLTLFSITVEAYCSSTEAYNTCWKS